MFPYFLAPDAPNISGVKTSVVTLIKGLTEAGVGSKVLVPAANPDYDHDFLDAGAERVLSLGMSRHLVFERHRADAGYLARYPARLREETGAVAGGLPGWGVDLVHSHGSAFLGACRAARRLGWPTVLHVHEDVVRLPGWAAWLYLRRAPRLADRLACCAEYLAEQFVRAGAARARVSAVPNAVDLDRFSPEGSRAVRVELGLKEDEILIGFVGRLVPGKDPARFVEAARLAAARLPEARFVVVGAADDSAHRGYVEGLRRVAAGQALAGRMSFLGARGDIEEVFRSLDLFVMCSHNEAMPNTVLEAMACGVAVIDQSGGGAAEALGHGQAQGEPVGLEVPMRPGDEAPKVLADAIVELAQDGARRRRLGAAARKRAEERYSREAMTAAMVAMYEDVMREHVARGRGRRAEDA